MKSEYSLSSHHSGRASTQAARALHDAQGRMVQDALCGLTQRNSATARDGVQDADGRWQNIGIDRVSNTRALQIDDMSAESSATNAIVLEYLPTLKQQ